MGYQLVKEKQICVWGAGRLLQEYSPLLNPQLSVKGVYDADINKQGQTVTLCGKEYIILSPEEISGDVAVIIAVIDRGTEQSIKKTLDEKGIVSCHIMEAVDDYWGNIEGCEDQTEELPPINRMMKFIDCGVPIDSCNLNCDYCYLGQHGEFMHRIPRFHSAKFIRKALSRKRMGGSVFINFCGVGETLLCKELLPIVEELVAEGHYVQIVTNATISKMVNNFIESSVDLSHVFFKCSFHYLQFKKKNLLSEFAKNVRKLREAGAAVSVELAPEDALVPYIEEIKDFSMREFGALPHLTVTRDERYEDLRILTEYPEEEYRKIWSVFNSPMFEFKMDHRKPQRYHNCKAGNWALQMNLETGDILQCVGNRYLGNIYDLTKELDYQEVGKGCMLPYCYNCHAYLTLGLIPGVEAPTYFEMRDRVTTDGKHWVNETMQDFFSQKLYDNNMSD